MLAVQVGEHAAEFGAQVPVQRAGLGLDHGDLAAGLPGGAGHLQPDPARADDHHLAAAAQRGREALAVTDPAQVHHALQVSPRHAKAARGRAGG